MKPIAYGAGLIDTKGEPMTEEALRAFIQARLEVGFRFQRVAPTRRVVDEEEAVRLAGPFGLGDPFLISGVEPTETGGDQ